MSSLLGRDEIRRLEKAARDKNKQKLIDWVRQFEHQLDTLLRKDYEKLYHYRGSPDNSKINLCKEIQDLHFSRLVVGSAYNGYKEAQHHTQQHGKKCYDKRCFQTIREVLPSVALNEGAVQLIHKIAQ